MSAPEWSRTERVDTIGERERQVAIRADGAERAALARRFGLPAIERLEAQFAIKREAAGIVVRGTVSADVVQACVVTDVPVPATIREPVALRFVDAQEAGGEEELELSEDALDELPIEHGVIDLGEAAAETLALALDPFPRAPEAAVVLREAGVISEEEAKPAGALSGLKALLEKKG